MGTTAESSATAHFVTLGAATLGAVANCVVLGPLARQTMQARKQQEVKDGRLCREEPVSEEMGVLNKRFGMVHGLSMVFNLVTFVGLLAYGVVMTDSFLTAPAVIYE